MMPAVSNGPQGKGDRRPRIVVVADDECDLALLSAEIEGRYGGAYSVLVASTPDEASDWSREFCGAGSPAPGEVGRRDNPRRAGQSPREDHVDVPRRRAPTGGQRQSAARDTCRRWSRKDRLETLTLANDATDGTVAVRADALFVFIGAMQTLAVFT